MLHSYCIEDAGIDAFKRELSVLKNKLQNEFEVCEGYRLDEPLLRLYWGLVDSVSSIVFELFGTHPKMLFKIGLLESKKILMISIIEKPGQRAITVLNTTFYQDFTQAKQSSLESKRWSEEAFHYAFKR